MTFPQGINFRATSGFVTDGAGDTFEIGTTANYPRTTAQGNTVGWEDAITGTRDRTVQDAKLSGIHYLLSSAGVTARFRVDLPSTGSWNIRVAGGDNAGVGYCKLELFDTTTSLGILVNHPTTTSTGANYFFDATNTEYTYANWLTSNTAVSKTFTTTIARFKLGSGNGNNEVIAHLRVEAAAGGTNTPINPTAATLAIAGFAPAVVRTANQWVAPSPAALSFAGFAPTVVISASQNINPGASNLGVSGFAPTISQPHAVTPSPSTMGISGFPVGITQAINQAINPGVKALALSGFAPTIAQTNNRSAAPGVGSLGLSGFAPTVTRTTTGPVTYSGTITFRPLRTKPMRVVRLA